ncbi:MAG TPA: hypothetical protein VMT76_15910 [Puia sp.]|nr:hypothetical protein [Puia sp.]
MNKRYAIQVTMRCEQDAECIATFNLGRNGTLASDLFRRLRGNPQVTEKDPLQMEFIELTNELPLIVDIISCTLAEIGENSKLITRELFKSKLLFSD